VTLIGFTGHQRVPEVARAFVATRIVEALQAVPAPASGITSLAAGADLLFGSAVLALGLKLSVVIPCAGFEATLTDPADLATFRRLTVSARDAETLDFPEPSEEAFMAAGAHVVDRCDLLIAVWDGARAQGLGGTGDVVAYARRRFRPVTVVWPAGLRR
jgi:hypothetical protein